MLWVVRLARGVLVMVASAVSKCGALTRRRLSWDGAPGLGELPFGLLL
jgi:hypothetical protein